MTRTPCLTWAHVGDLHMDEANGWQSRDRLAAIITELNDHVGEATDFVYLPGDHDVELGDLAHYDAAFPRDNRSEAEVIAGHRCIFLDIVSAGAGGPDFRLTMHHRNHLLDELARAEADGQTPVVFMHAYPGDLAADGEDVAPADLRLVTRPADATQVPRPGEVAIVAKLFGNAACPVMLSIDDADPQPMVPTSGTALWTARVVLEAGLHRIVASVGTDCDIAEILVRGERDLPRRGIPVAPGRDIHSIGAWPDHGIAGTQLGPNKNGRHW